MNRLWKWTCVAVATATFALTGIAWADPPGRIVRLGYANGAVSFLPAGATDWVTAELNRPLSMGDRLWTGPGARAELQMGSSAMRIAPGTSVSVVAFDDRVEQYEVAQGTVRLRVRSMDRDDTVEIDTPNLAFSIRSPGDYRIDVDAEGTTVAVYRGDAEAFGTQNAYTLGAGMRARFAGTDLDYLPVALARSDAFDTWTTERTGLEDRSISARYVPPEMIGYSDLDANGSWRTVRGYGPVWAPTSVAPDWAPYRYGRWLWVDPWGWTWVDDAPWGFAPFHYGRWAFVESRWCWVPGPRTVRPVYAPALVAFVGGSNFSASVSLGAAANVAWFPLAPGEVYRPAYAASREYFTRVNVTNTVVNVTQVTNVYNNPARTDIRYTNVAQTNAVTAVSTQAFVDARPVQRATIKVDAQALQRAPIVAAPAQLGPAKQSIVGAAPPAQARPAPAVTERTFIAKHAPPPPPPSIEQRHEALQRQPGKPLDQAELQKIAPPQTAARPNMKVVQPAAPPKALPPTATAPVQKEDEKQKEAPPQTARTQNAPPMAQPPGRPSAAVEKEKEALPPTTAARPEPKGRAQTMMPPQQEARPEAKGAPQPMARPLQEARPSNVPPPPAAELQTPPRTAMTHPESAPRANVPPPEREALQRPGAPRGKPEQASPAPQPQAAPAPSARPETANVPRPAEPPRQQAAAPQVRGPEGRPPKAAPPEIEKAPTRAAPEKGKGKDNEKDKKDEGK
jgi:hypothetical protein